MNVIGFDDGPFPHDHRGNVLLVGAVCAGTRLDGVVSGRIRRDGADATREMIRLVRESPFVDHVRAVLLQGIAVGGFNVVDVQSLSRELRLPVLVVMRRSPDLSAVKRALFSASPASRPRVRGAARKWGLIEGAGPIEELSVSHRSLRRTRVTGLREALPHLYLQRVGMSLDAARQIVQATTLHGNIPEPLRLAHIIAGGIATGKSRGRP
jgi:endonuclease V-like protein UPF0215 family